MLVLSRNEQRNERDIIIGDNIRVRVLRISGGNVKLGIEAPRDTRIVRAEIDERRTA